MSAKLLVRNATLLTMAPEHADAPFVGWLSVAPDGTIARLEPGEPPAGLAADQVIDADGCLVAPGFVSAHSHLFTSGSRGLGTDCTLYGWGVESRRYTLHSDADDIYWLTLHGALDFLNNGITTAYDFTDNRLAVVAMDRGSPTYAIEIKPLAYATAQVKAKVDAGIRFVNSVRLDDARGTDDEILERFEQVLSYAEQFRATGQYLRMAISGAVQWSPTRRTAEIEVRAMRRYQALNQPHLLETAEVLEIQRPKFDWYRDAGAFGRDLVFGHFVHAEPAMIAEAARCGCGMVWQPTSNGRLASGIADVPACIAAGMRVGVGLDDQSCTDISDPWQNMRMGIYMQRAHKRDARAMGVAQMLRLHTLGSAEVLGIDDRVGSLRPGRFADFLIVDPRAPDTGPMWNPVATYVLACGLRNLKAVYVGGDLVGADGRIVRPLAAEASRQVHQRLRRIAAAIGAAAPSGSAPS
jgi:cytosine/adenosine deaminase-related metal-dependent hydrolase